MTIMSLPERARHAAQRALTIARRDTVLEGVELARHLKATPPPAPDGVNYLHWRQLFDSAVELLVYNIAAYRPSDTKKIQRERLGVDAWVNSDPIVVDDVPLDGGLFDLIAD